METNKKINELLNQLIQINNDRIDGYEKAAKDTKDSDLKSLFTGMASKSRMLKNELSMEVTSRGGEPTQSTTTSGKVFRAWMDFKAALTGKDRMAILNSCEFGEDAALHTYDDVLKSGESLPPNLVILMQQQRERLQQDHDQVKTLRDTEVHV